MEECHLLIPIPIPAIYAQSIYLDFLVAPFGPGITKKLSVEETDAASLSKDYNEKGA